MCRGQSAEDQLPTKCGTKPVRHAKLTGFVVMSKTKSESEIAIAPGPPAAMAVVPALPPVLCAAMALQFAVGGAVIPFVTLLLRDRGLDFSHISQIFLASSGTLLVFPFLWGL